MKCKHTGRELKSAGNLAGRHSVRAGLHQQAEHVETIILRERGESCDSISLFHIPTNIEQLLESQESLQRILK